MTRQAFEILIGTSAHVWIDSTKGAVPAVIEGFKIYDNPLYGLGEEQTPKRVLFTVVLMTGDGGRFDVWDDKLAV
jgi:hypothetical protein